MSYKYKNYSKFVATATTATLVASAIVPVASANEATTAFSDVSGKYKEAVDYLVNENLSSGLNETEFGVQATIKRGDAAIILAKALGIVEDEEAAASGFSDVPKRATLAINSLKAAGIIKGKSTTNFGFEDNLTRGEVALLMANVKAYNLSGDVSSLKFTDVIGTRYESAVAGMVEAGITSGKTPTSFGTGDAIKRGDFAIFVYKAEIATATPEVVSVEATTSRVDDNTAGQFLGLTINGGDLVSVQSLVDAGFTVDFQATESVFKDATTGELKETLSADFSYKVVVSKDGIVVESALSEVEVLDFSTFLTGLSEVTVDQGDVSVTSGKVSVQDGVVNVLATKATTLSGATVNNPTTVTYKSSNPAVASVNATTGDVTPIQAGTVTIKATADDASVSVPLTVVSGARQATTATATTTSVKLLATKTQTVDFTVVDQYGDEFEGDLSIVSRDAAIANGSSKVTFTDGEATETVTALTKGNTVIDLKNGTTTIKSVNVSVSDDAVVASRKVETLSASADLALDVVTGSTDQNVELVWNQFNAGGFLIGAETNYTNGTLAGTTYTVSSSDEDVATVAVAADGKITVSGIKEGTANVVIKEGTVTRATAQVTVTDTTPTITSVDFETVEDVITKGALNAQVLKAEGITLSSTDYNAEIDATTGTIFIDVEGTPAGLDAGDIKLGTFDAIYSGDQADLTTLGVSAGSITAADVAAGAEGTIVASVTLDGKSEVFATSTINVNVPK